MDVHSLEEPFISVYGQIINIFNDERESFIWLLFKWNGTYYNNNNNNMNNMRIQRWDKVAYIPLATLKNRNGAKIFRQA